MVLNLDKGNAVVLMNKVDYHGTMTKQNLNSLKTIKLG